MRTDPLNPACLPSGTQVGPWRVVDRRGRGTYGAVYLAMEAEQEAASLVALKVSLHPRDARFAREEEAPASWPKHWSWPRSARGRRRMRLSS